MVPSNPWVLRHVWVWYSLIYEIQRLLYKLYQVLFWIKRSFWFYPHPQALQPLRREAWQYGWTTVDSSNTYSEAFQYAEESCSSLGKQLEALCFSKTNENAEFLSVHIFFHHLNKFLLFIFMYIYIYLPSKKSGTKFVWLHKMHTHMTSFCEVGIEVAKSISHRELSWLVMDLAFHSRDAWFWLCLFEIGSYLWVPSEFQTTNPIQQLTIGWLLPVWYIDLFLDHLLIIYLSKIPPASQGLHAQYFGGDVFMQALPGRDLDWNEMLKPTTLTLHIFLRPWDRSDSDLDSPESWYTFHRNRRPFNYPLQEGKQAKLRWISGEKKVWAWARIEHSRWNRW